jgi:C1A family cysteine protease
MVELEDVRRAIADAGANWSARDTSVSRLSPEERLLRLGYEPAGDQREPSLDDRSDRARVKKGQPRTGADNLGWYDLRVADGGIYTSPIADQGACKACVAFGTAVTVEATLRRSRGYVSPDPDLSEAQMFFCYGTAGFAVHHTDVHCNRGWEVTPLLEAITASGVVPEACFPYRDIDMCCEDCCDDPPCEVGLCPDADAQSIAISDFVAIADENQKREWILTRGPLITAMTIFEDFDYYAGGVYEHVAGAELPGGHCVSCIGFNDTGGYWICQNSVGPDWGELGYFSIAYGEVGIDDVMWGIIP